MDVSFASSYVSHLGSLASVASIGGGYTPLLQGRMLENIPHLKFIRVSYVARMETQLPLT